MAYKRGWQVITKVQLTTHPRPVQGRVGLVRVLARALAGRRMGAIAAGRSETVACCIPHGARNVGTGQRHTHMPNVKPERVTCMRTEDVETIELLSSPE